jgi:hypothetical protein
MHTHILAFGIGSKQGGSFKLPQGKFSAMHWLEAWRRPRIITDMAMNKKNSRRNQTTLITAKAKAKNFTMLSQDVSTC